MNNKLRIAIKVIISIIIWLVVAVITYYNLENSVSYNFMPYEPNTPLYGEFFGDNLFLGSLFYFILIPGILIFLFNKFLLTKKSTTDNQLRIISKILISILIFIIVGAINLFIGFPIKLMFDDCETYTAPNVPSGIYYDLNLVFMPCTSYYLFGTYKIPDQLPGELGLPSGFLQILLNLILIPGIFVLLFNIFFLKKMPSNK